MTTANPYTLREMRLPQARSDVIFCAVEDGAVLLAAEDEVYFGLNEVGALIWDLLPPKASSLDELCDGVALAYPDADPDVIRADVVDLLAQLQEHGLVVPDGASTNSESAA